MDGVWPRQLSRRAITVFSLYTSFLQLLRAFRCPIQSLPKFILSFRFLRSSNTTSFKMPPVLIATKPINPPTLGRNNYKGFMPGYTEILRKGWNGYRSRALPCDILVEHDVGIRMRDGARLYVDIYRSPETSSSIEFRHCLVSGLLGRSSVVCQR